MRTRRALLYAALVVFLLGHVIPFGGLVLYPLTLLATWVHETGHGVAALLTGGHFERLEIFWDASGFARTREGPGWPVAITCLGGLLAPPLVGMILFLVARTGRRAFIALVTLAAGLAITWVAVVRSPVGVVVVPAEAVALALIAWRSSERRRMIVAHVLAVSLALDTLGRMVHYVFSRTAAVGGEVQKSDVVAIADAVGGHYLLWGLLITAVALGMLAVGVFFAWREKPAAPPRAKAATRPSVRSL